MSLTQVRHSVRHGGTSTCTYIRTLEGDLNLPFQEPMLSSIQRGAITPRRRSPRHRRHAIGRPCQPSSRRCCSYWTGESAEQPGAPRVSSPAPPRRLPHQRCPPRRRCSSTACCGTAASAAPAPRDRELRWRQRRRSCRQGRHAGQRPSHESTKDRAAPLPSASRARPSSRYAPWRSRSARAAPEPRLRRRTDHTRHRVSQATGYRVQGKPGGGGTGEGVGARGPGLAAGTAKPWRAGGGFVSPPCALLA